MLRLEALVRVYCRKDSTKTPVSRPSAERPSLQYRKRRQATNSIQACFSFNAVLQTMSLTARELRDNISLKEGAEQHSLLCFSVTELLHDEGHKWRH